MQKEQLIDYLLHLADNALILGHRNSEWTGHGPILEQDIAVSNIALDLIGQARNFYQYAAELSGSPATEDSLAYLRDAGDFKNCLLVEQENGHWGTTILRQFFFSVYQAELFRLLHQSRDERIAAIAEKSLKEAGYHLRWSGEWVIRLGRGTTESHLKMSAAITELWVYTAELKMPADYETALLESGISADLSLLAQPWQKTVLEVLSKAAISIPGEVSLKYGGKQGNHGPLLTALLNEMQYLQRTYPGAEW